MQELPSVPLSTPPSKIGSMNTRMVAGPCHLLRVDQLLARADLPGGDEVLHARHHHRDHDPRLRGAGHHGGHANLHHLRLDLMEAGLQLSPSGAFRIKDPGRAHERVDDVADQERELLDTAIDTGTDNVFHLGLRQFGLGAGFLGGEQACQAGLRLRRSGRGGGDRALTSLHRDLELLDVAHCHGARVAPVDLLFGLQFVDRLLVGALRLGDPSAPTISARAPTMAASVSAILRRAESAWKGHSVTVILSRGSSWLADSGPDSG
jgi:hypothetical protein